VGSTIEPEVFLATGSAVFHGSHLGTGAEVRINGVVHLRTRPATEHDAIWKVQEPLNVPLTVYGFERAEASMTKITRRLSRSLASHLEDARADGRPGAGLHLDA
jgi:carbonic anhydrase/acetyltransferase-like protein (isoleucine patch superfamily)